jgi:cation transport ATPase
VKTSVPISELLAKAPWISTPSNVQADRDGQPGAGSAQGVQGNSRLTSATGIVLIALLLVEGVTILSVRQMITLHIYVGVLLLGPVLLKTGTTLYRFVRYYRGAPAYRKKGAPHPVLRVLGPVVILSSLALLGTGVALIFVGDHRADWLLTAHQTSFWVWVAVMTVHVIGHVVEALMTSRAEIRGAWRGPRPARSRWRLVVIAVALVLGVGTATVLLPHATSWTTGSGHRHDRSDDASH